MSIKHSGFRPKKSLGQNFLVDRNVLGKIVDALHLGSDDVVLEIGPGTGLLTELIQPRVRRLIAVELDRDLAGILRVKFFSCDNFQLIEQDFLKTDLADLSQSQLLRVVGNIPYYITSDILFKVIDQRARVRDMVLLMQKEVAQRIVASPGCKDYGILSVFSQTFADVEILLQIPRTVFTPRPKVDSALVHWTFTEERSGQIRNEAIFRKLVRKAFGQRRKMLRKSLREVLMDKEFPGWDWTLRPEQLTVQDWIRLANEPNIAF